MFSEQNAGRAKRARRALAAYDNGYDSQDYVDEDTISAIYDLMCDLAHLADLVALDSRSDWESTSEVDRLAGDEPRAGSYCLGQAEYHYNAEITGDD